jgi:hypothetical protein
MTSIGVQGGRNEQGGMVGFFEYLQMRATPGADTNHAAARFKGSEMAQ